MSRQSLINDFIIDVRNDKFFPIKVISDSWDKYSHNIYINFWNDDNSKMIAFGMIRGWDEGWDEKVLGLIVHPDERGHGLGTFVIQELENEAREEGVTQLRLHVSPQNKTAINLYHKMGYHKDGTREDGEWIMRKEL
jgi:ribosomal protein S18 acetylase RimI-like enzyme